MNKGLILTIALTVALKTSLLSQNISAKGEFEVDFIRGCNPLTVNITNNLSVPGAVTVYWYKGIASRPDEGTSSTYTYDETGVFTLYQITRTGASITNFDSIRVSVFDSPPPEYQLFKCSGNQAVVLLTDVYYEQFEIDYDTADPSNTPIVVTRGQSVPAYTYPGPGNYTVSVRGQFQNAADNCSSRSEAIDIVNSLPPGEIQRVVIDNDTDITIEYLLAPNVRYLLEVGINSSTNFQNVALIDNSTSSFTISGLETGINRYCFRISTLDVCNTSIITSPVICTVLNTVSAENNQNRVSWNTIDPGISSFSIVRDGGILVTVAPGQRQLVDIFVQCNTAYCYQVLANYPSGVSLSAERCVTAFSTDQPAAITDISADVNEDNIDIQFRPPVNFTPSSYYLSRSIDNGSFQFVDSLQNPTFQDSGLDTDDDLHCYRVQYEDVCGNISETSDACAILLNARFDPLQNALLQWNAFEGWSNGVANYYLEILDDTGLLVSSINVGNALEYRFRYEDFPIQVLQFRIRAETFLAGFSDVNSNIERLTLKPRISVPDAFSPNGDGLNEEWLITGRFYVSSAEMRIYNRWGELIFFSDEFDRGWDGSFNGEVAPPGAYTYRIDYFDTIGRPFVNSGNLILMR